MRSLRPTDSIREPRVVHVNDCAYTAANLIRAARAEGLPWSFIPVPTDEAGWQGRLGQLRRVAKGARWLAEVQRAAVINDLLHIHSGSLLQHTRYVRSDFVLHMHGSDLTYLAYDPAWQPRIRWGLQHAAHVYYSTPDLAAHALPHRPDAEHLPQPIDLGALPAWHPAERPTVVFCSRWDPRKGSPTQIAVARRLREIAPPDVRILGLDWGDDVEAARATGIELIPRSGHESYLALLAAAHVVVGQFGGLLSVSELEAMAIGPPVLSPVVLEWYADPPPLLGPHLPPHDGKSPAALDYEDVDAAARVVLNALVEPAALASSLHAAGWVDRHHSAQRAMTTVRDRYRRILSAR